MAGQGPGKQPPPPPPGGAGGPPPPPGAAVAIVLPIQAEISARLQSAEFTGGSEADKRRIIREVRKQLAEFELKEAEQTRAIVQLLDQIVPVAEQLGLDDIVREHMTRYAPGGKFRDILEQGLLTHELVVPLVTDTTQIESKLGEYLGPASAGGVDSQYRTTPMYALTQVEPRKQKAKDSIAESKAANEAMMQALPALKAMYEQANDLADQRIAALDQAFDEVAANLQADAEVWNGLKQKCTQLRMKAPRLKKPFNDVYQEIEKANKSIGQAAKAQAGGEAKAEQESTLRLNIKDADPTDQEAAKQNIAWREFFAPGPHLDNLARFVGFPDEAIARGEITLDEVLDKYKVLTESKGMLPARIGHYQQIVGIAAGYYQQPPGEIDEIRLMEKAVTNKDNEAVYTALDEYMRGLLKAQDIEITRKPGVSAVAELQNIMGKVQAPKGKPGAGGGGAEREAKIAEAAAAGDKLAQAQLKGMKSKIEPQEGGAGADAEDPRMAAVLQMEQEREGIKDMYAKEAAEEQRRRYEQQLGHEPSKKEVEALNLAEAEVPEDPEIARRHQTRIKSLLTDKTLAHLKGTMKEKLATYAVQLEEKVQELEKPEIVIREGTPVAIKKALESFQHHNGRLPSVDEARALCNNIQGAKLQASAKAQIGGILSAMELESSARRKPRT